MADDVEELISELTTAEKCAMVIGTDSWSVAGCERLGIPSWRVSDGPVGVRGQANGRGLVLPGPSSMAATWDVALVELLGTVLGVECVDRGVDMLLGPTVNLHRSPHGGRHFEAFSEDPELTARMAVAYITGVQSQGVGACVKHYIANEQEQERFTIEAQVDERTLREVYLPPFEAAVTESGARAVMAAYNYVNGEHACSQAELLQGVLKGEWGFEGVVVSDWGAVKETLAPARHGLDLEMPGPGQWWGGGKLDAAIASGTIDEALVDDKVRRILRFLAWRGRLPDVTTGGEERSVERIEHRELVRRAAADGMVLIKNQGLLPLAPGSSLALIGPGAASTALLGGGSASLEPYRVRTVLEALSDRWSARVTHAEGVRLRRGPPTFPATWLSPGGVEVELYDSAGFDGAPVQVERRPSPSNWWYGKHWPEGVDRLSVRLRFTMTPHEGGTHRIMGAGFGRTRLFIEGALVTDTDVNGFSAGLGRRGAESELELEGGRGYAVVLEQLAEEGGVRAALTDVGVEPVHEDREALLIRAESAAAAADVAVVVVGSNQQWESEGSDRESIALPAGQDELVGRVLAANPRTVVVLNCGAPMLLPWLDDVPAALLAWYPGQEAGDAIVDVLTGQAEPGGRMPTTWAKAERDTPSYLHYPGEAGVVRYGEELHVGYRWYDARAIEPQVPFGHGGSYTAFAWGQPSVTGSDSDVLVEVPVTNIGDRPGSDVVQVYVSQREPPVLRPLKELVGFAKVRVEPGTTAVARIVLQTRAFARWDMVAHAWLVDVGAYDIIVAASAADERHRVEHVVGSSYDPAIASSKS